MKPYKTTAYSRKLTFSFTVMEKKIAGRKCQGNSPDFCYSFWDTSFFDLLQHLIPMTLNVLKKNFSLIFFLKDFSFWEIQNTCNTSLSTKDFNKRSEHAKLLLDIKENKKYFKFKFSQHLITTILRLFL